MALTTRCESLLCHCSLHLKPACCYAHAVTIIPFVLLTAEPWRTKCCLCICYLSMSGVTRQTCMFWLVVSLPESAMRFCCTAEVLLTCAALVHERQYGVHTGQHDSLCMFLAGRCATSGGYTEGLCKHNECTAVSWSYSTTLKVTLQLKSTLCQLHL